MEDLFVKAATVIAVALATFSSFPSTAQQQYASQQQQSSPMPTARPQSPSQRSSEEVSPAAAQLKRVSGELVDKLDSKSARQGDSVVVKTDQNLTISAGTEIPKGSKLVGHITNVQARGDGKENSQIAIQFDRAELKGGQTLPIESVIESVAPAAGSEMSNSNNGAYANGAYGAAQTSPSGPGGTASSPQAMNQPGNPGMNNVPSQSTMDNRPGSAPNATTESQTMGQTGAMNTPAAGSIVARNGNVAIRATAIPGVLLANDIHGLPFSNASGMILGSRRDVHLDGGTRITLAVAMAPQGAGSGMSR